MAKIPHSTTRTKKTSKKPSTRKNATVRLMAYYGLNFWNTAHVTEALAIEIANDMFDWACKEPKTSLTITKYLRERGIPTDLFYNAIKKYPYLKKAHGRIKDMIGDNRETGGLEKRLSERMILRSQHQYSKEWKESDEWWATLTKAERDAAEQFIFELRDLTKKDTK